MTWKYKVGFYFNKNFRIFRERRKWWLSDIRNGAKDAPSWWFYSAKEAKKAAEVIIKKPCRS